MSLALHHRASRKLIPLNVVVKLFLKGPEEGEPPVMSLDRKITLHNIDVDAKSFRILSDFVGRSIEEEKSSSEKEPEGGKSSANDGRGVVPFLFHRRKGETDVEVMKQTVRRGQNIAVHLSEGAKEIEGIYFLDCGLGEERLTSDFTVLARIMESLSESLGDVLVEVLLIDGQVQSKGSDGYSIEGITMRNIKDPSFVQDHMARLAEGLSELGLEFDFDKIASENQELAEVLMKVLESAGPTDQQQAGVSRARRGRVSPAS